MKSNIFKPFGNIIDFLGCGSPPTIENGNVGSESSYDVGTELEYTCNDTYSTRDATETRCTANHVWSLNTLPTCVKSKFIYINVSVSTTHI